MADRREMGIDDYKAVLEGWNREVRKDGELFMVNDVPEIVEDYFEHYAEAIQKEKTYGDTWQAGSRAKDSLAKVRSVLVCLGWRDSDIWEMIKWGGTRSIKYKIGGGEVVRTVEGQRTVIGPPNVIHLDCMDRILDWMNGGALVSDVVGFDVDLQGGILNMLMYSDVVTSAEVWINLSRNMGIGYGSEGSRNGYMVGAVRTFMAYNEFDRYIDCKEVGHGSFVFERADEDKVVEGKIGTYEMEIMLKVLKSAFLIKKDRVTLGDLKNRGSMTEVQIQMALYNIVKFEILRGSNWEINNKSRMKKGKKVMEFMVVKNKKESVVNKKKSKILVDFAGKADQKYVMLELLRWQEDESELEVTVGDIYRNVPVRRKVIGEVLEGFGKDGVLGKYGLACDVDMKKRSVVRNIAKV